LEQETILSRAKERLTTGQIKEKPGGISAARMRGITAPPPIPDAFETMLPSGLVQKWRMPDPFSLVMFDSVIPDPLTASVLDLLKMEKSYVSETDPMRHKHESQNIRGMYGLGQAMAVDPKWNVSVEYGSNGTLGRREIGYQDVVAMFQMWRFGTRQPSLPSPDADESERTEGVVSSSENVRSESSTTDGD
jgi:hypothetical protein